MHPGQCWRLHGTSSRLGVRLAHPHVLGKISLDHPSSMTVNRAYAPREFEVYVRLRRCGIVKGRCVGEGGEGAGCTAYWLGCSMGS